MKLFTQQEIQSSEASSLDSSREKQRILSSVISLREKELRALNAEIEVKRKDKLEEIAALEQRILELTRSELATIKVLEDRRNTALRPITEELQHLDAVRLEIEAAKAELSNKELDLNKLKQSISSSDALLNQKKTEFEGYKAVSFEEIERHKKSADNSREMALITAKLLQEEQVRAEKKRKLIEEKEESLKRAEERIKKAMSEADEKIAEQVKLQKQTDDKRKLLANAIKELKKKGLWHKLEEMGIK
jgi:hypothetical protein